MPVYSEGTDANPVEMAPRAIDFARKNAHDVVILDTAGRLHIDEQMMTELQQIEARVHPHEVLLVADAMTGQDAVHAAKAFHRAVKLSGMVLTKMDGDARGGAALSIREVTGVPIKFMAVGEKPDALEVFHPDRLAQRILGMGDVLSLIEKAQQQYTEDEAKALEKKMRTATFDLDDFLKQMQQVRKMGPLTQLVEMIPGMRGAMKQMGGVPDLNDKEVKRVEAIILSMTVKERRNPGTIDGSRRRRIARGSGTSVQEVNQLLNQFREVQKMMKQLTSGKMRVPKGLTKM
jgi:signal recognition particle subunit SRP54